MGRAPGGAKGTSDPSALPTDPLGRIRHEFRTLGSSLDRFDARVKSALRKIPGSRMPPPGADARASRAASAPKPSLFDRLRNGAKGNASATREPETASRGSRKENTTTKKARAAAISKNVPKAEHAPADPPGAGRPKPAERPPKKAVSEAKATRADAKTRAEDSEVRDYISRSYAPKDDDGSGEKGAPDDTSSPTMSPASPASSRPAKSALMPPRSPQKVTVADLDDADRDLIARARAAMAHVEPTPFNLAAGAAALLAAHLLAKAWRARRAGPAAEDKVELDIDSAFGTPIRASAPTSRRTDAAAKGKAPAPAPATRTASAKRLVFGDEKATALQPEELNSRDRARVPKRASSSKQNRFGVGADALAAAALAKTAVIKATRRLKRSGELRVDVLEVTFTRAFDARVANDDDTGYAGSIPETFAFRVAVDAGANASIRGSTAARAFDNKRRRDVVTFNKRLAFSLPASSDGHAGKKIEARLCDGEGRTIAKTAMLLRAALRAAPVTKSFPLHDRAGAICGNARLAVEWDYDDEAREDANAKENEKPAVSAAARLLAAVKE